MTEPRIFISYARSDGEIFATELRNELETRFGEGTVWMDRFGLSGGEDWWRQIVDALNKVDFLVLVATPGAMASRVVGKEWRYARQQGVCVFPVLMPDNFPTFETMQRWMSSLHFYDFNHAIQREKLFNDLNTLCQAPRQPFMAPDLPTHFVERPAKFNELVAKLLDGDRQNPVAITTALRGAGGFGKTTLAAALCHDDDVQTAFDDGVLWVTLGENPDTLGGLTKLYAALSGERPSFVDAEDAANHLTEKLAELDCLIVIDDVWNPAHLRPFLRGGERCARLITTRMMDVAVGANAETTEVDEMTADESVAMLLGGIEKPSSQTLLPQGEGLKTTSTSDDGVAALSAELKAAFRKLAGRLGEWPLMLELANGALRKRMARGDTVERALDYLNDLLADEGAAAFDPRNPQERNQAIGASVGASLRLLESHERERLYDLSIFKDDIDIPITTIQQLWDDAKRLQTERLCEAFADLSLVKFDVENGMVRLHDVIREYLGKQLTEGTTVSVHAWLVDVWGNPYALPDDFSWRWYAYHLIGAGQDEHLRELLLDCRWLQAKLDATDASALIADCETLPADSTIRLLKSALNMSAHVLVEDKTALAHQLVGRLMTHRGTNAEIRTLTDALMTLPGIYPSNPDNKYPILNQAGGVLLRTLSGHTGGLNGATQLADGRLLSWARDNTLRLWEVDGAALAVLEGHASWVSGATQLADGRLLSWARDNTLRLWEVDGAALAVLEGHISGVRGAIQLADGHLLSWSQDHTLRLWESDGAALTVMRGHTSEVNGTIQLADGRLLSWSQDHTLRLWESDSAALAVLGGHTDGVSGAMQLADGRLLSWASGEESRDHTLRLWDADGVTLAVIEGHNDGVSGAMQLVDGRLLSWAGDNTLRLWEVNGTALAVLTGHTSWVSGAMQLADGRLLSWAGDSTLRLWDVNGTALAVLTGHTDRVDGARQLADGRLLSWASGSLSQDHMLRLWDADGAALAVMEGHTYEVRGTIQLADGRLLSWSDDNTLRLWDVDGVALAVMEGHTYEISGAIQLADGRLLSWAGDGTLRLWDVDGAVLAVMEGHTRWVSGARLLADGRLLSWAGDGTLRLWDVNGTALAVLTGHTDRVDGARQLADGRLLSWAGRYASKDRTLRLWEANGAALAVLHMLEEDYLHGNRERIYAWARDHNFNADVLYEDRNRVVADNYRVRHEYNSSRLELYRRSDNVRVATFHADARISCVITIPDQRLIVAGDWVGRVMFMRLVE